MTRMRLGRLKAAPTYDWLLVGAAATFVGAAATFVGAAATFVGAAATFVGAAATFVGAAFRRPFPRRSVIEGRLCR
jgi:hypothetical protein